MIAGLTADAYGGRAAVAGPDGELGYDALAGRIERRATLLRQAAAAVESRHVAYLGLSGATFLEHLLACAQAGLAFMPLNYRTGASELASLLEAFRPALVVHDDDYADKAAACSGGSTPLPTNAALPQDALDVHPGDGDEVAVILHTSGTTSRPKAVLLRHRHLCSYIFGVVDFASAGADETAIVTTPPYHIAGIMGVLTPLYSGRRMVFLPRFDARDWLTTASAYNATHAFLVPTMLARIVDALTVEPRLQPRSLRHIAYGGGPIHTTLVERALELFPGVDFVNAYGLTETSSTVALLGPEDHRTALASDDPRMRRRLQSVGRPLPGVEIRIVRDDGEEAAADEVGTITIAGAQVSGQYHGRDSGSAWFTTGDLGYVDDDGYLFIGARADDVIIRGGENISPGEVEDVLARHPDVRAVAVVGAPDEEWGQCVVAFVEPRAPDHAGSDELREFARGALASFKLPARVVFVDELPRTDTGKVLRTRLREQLSDAAARPV